MIRTHIIIGLNERDLEARILVMGPDWQRHGYIFCLNTNIPSLTVHAQLLLNLTQPLQGETWVVTPPYIAPGESNLG